MMMAVLLVVGLAIGGGVGYFMAPKETVPGETTTVEVEVLPLDGKTIRIANLMSGTSALETGVPWAEEVNTPAMNTYAENLGYDVTYTILNDQADSQAAVHLEKVQSFKAMDIGLIKGGGWSSMAQSALSYVNENNVLLWSSSSTSPVLRIADDNLFRMCPDDTIQAPAIAEMLWSWGIEHIIVIQRADSWADGIYNILEPEFTSRGGQIHERIRYAGEVTEFSSYLATADSIAQGLVEQYGAEHVGIEVIAFSEYTTMATQCVDYPTIYDLVWFGSDGTALGAQIRDDAPEMAIHMQAFSTYAAPAKGELWYYLYDESMRISDTPVGYYTCAGYDLYMNMVETTLLTQSEDPTDVIPMIIPTCYNLWGSSGWCKLNEAGDRAVSNYDIWGYGWDPDVPDECVNVNYGFYDATSGTVTWFTTAEIVDGRPIPGVSPPGH
jgi:branched-chain amino acid transport system substrate-binding protein